MHGFEDAPFSSNEQADLRAIRDSLRRNEATLMSVQYWVSMLQTDPPNQEVSSDPQDPPGEKEEVDLLSDEEFEDLMEWMSEVDSHYNLAIDWQSRELEKQRTYRTEGIDASELPEERAQQIRQLRDLALEVRAASSALLKTVSALAAGHIGGQTEVWRRVLIRLYEEELHPDDEGSA
jgi:hypothetical protein